MVVNLRSKINLSICALNVNRILSFSKETHLGNEIWFSKNKTEFNRISIAANWKNEKSFCIDVLKKNRLSICIWNGFALFEDSFMFDILRKTFAPHK